MKKITLLVASILLVGSVANASAIINYSGEQTRTGFSLDEPIEFMERGIRFYIFSNGEFDFNTEQSTGGTVVYRHGINTTSGAPGRNTFTTNDGGIRIEHDGQGRVRRIGNVFVNYDSANRIKRIGSVYMTYNRIALTQVGGLRITYNRRGEMIGQYGSVKGYRSNYTAYETDYNTNSVAENQNEDSHYYYRQNGTKSKTEN